MPLFKAPGDVHSHIYPLNLPALTHTKLEEHAPIHGMQCLQLGAVSILEALFLEMLKEEKHLAKRILSLSESSSQGRYAGKAMEPSEIGVCTGYCMTCGTTRAMHACVPFP